MDRSIRSFKSSTISFLLLAVSSAPFAHGAAVNSYASICGYGYEHCPEGFDCVQEFNHGYESYASTCQKAGYSATVTYEPSTTNDYQYHQHSDYPSEPGYTSKPAYHTKPEYPSKSGYGYQASSGLPSQSYGYHDDKNTVYGSTPTSKDYYSHTPTSKGYSHYGPAYSSEPPSSYDSAYYTHPTTVSYPDYPDYSPQKYHKYQSAYSSDGVYAIPVPTSYPDYPYSCSCVCPGKPSNPGHPSYDPTDHSKYQGNPSYDPTDHSKYQGNPSDPKHQYNDPDNYPKYQGHPSDPKHQYNDPDNHSKYQGDQPDPGHQSYPGRQSYPGHPSYPGHQSYPGNSSSGTDKPSSNFTAVVGVPNKVVERREIDTLQSNYPDVFNMLVLALESLQSRNENNDLSYYQLSGIHGFPFIPWQYPAQNPEPQIGYCTHHSAIFTTWHRPYVVLIEQILHEEAVSIAKKFTGSDAAKYQAAASEVRMPYWDWAADSTDSRIPKVALEPSIAVIKPGSGNPTTIPNPFYNYHRQDIGVATIRGPTAETDLPDTFTERKSLTNNLFSDTSYDDFSKDLESIHDLVHVLVGGDMADVFRAAFDPIFWLHHCNVDRLTAMYQASHPGSYLSPQPRSPTFALTGPGPDDLSTPLYPFRHPNAREWTSDDIKIAESIFDYGYSYPEVPSGLSGTALQKFTTEKANELYGPKTADSSFEGDKSGAAAPTARREWTCNIVVDSKELPGSQKIRIYIGDSGKNNSQSYSNLAGVAAIFSSSQNPVSSPNRYLNITVPLTQTLIEKNIGLRPDDVVPKLVKNLHWVVEQVGSNKVIPVEDLKSLKISISSNIADYPEDKTKLPIKSDSKTYYAPTTDKAGGLQPGQASPYVGLPPVYNGTSTIGNSTA